MTKQDDLILDVAKMIWSRGMTIAEFYQALGVDLEEYRVDPDSVVTEIAGIFKGWQNTPPEDD